MAELANALRVERQCNTQNIYEVYLSGIPASSRERESSVISVSPSGYLISLRDGTIHGA